MIFGFNLNTLNLERNNLSGRLPSEFNNLTKLVELNLKENNNLSGTILPMLVNFSKLNSITHEI